jgi:SAM-dependent methyltransferase
MTAQAQAVLDPDGIKLNLGCCDKHLEGFCNVDRTPPADMIADLEHRWPWDDETVEEIVADDIFEHLPDKIHTMNEAWRVLKDGGLLKFRVPTTDGRGAFQDPTHRSFWTPNDLLYYVSGCPERERFSRPYGISARFAIATAQHREVTNEIWYLSAVLEALR